MRHSRSYRFLAGAAVAALGMVVIGSLAGVARQAAQAPTAPQAPSGGQAAAYPQREEQGGQEQAAPPPIGKEVMNFTPVTDELLRNPPPGEWLTWRRTLDGHGYSPLNQITRENVHELRLAWVWAMTEGVSEVTPL